MRRFSLPLVILLSVVIAACLTGLALAEGPERRDEAQSETTPLAPFKRIDISGAAVIVLVQDTNGPLIASVPQNASTKISIRVQKETLVIKASDGGHWWSNLFGRGPTATPQLIIHFKDLEGIDVSGVVKISAREVHVPALSVDGSGGTTLRIEDLRATTLSVDGSGALKAELSGQVTDQNVSISGAADYQAAKLVSDNATVEVSGAGKIVVNARKKLTASISGAGVVEYLGDPVVRESVSGVGRVKRRESAEAHLPPIARAD